MYVCMYVCKYVVPYVLQIYLNRSDVTGRKAQFQIYLKKGNRLYVCTVCTYECVWCLNVCWMFVCRAYVYVCVWCIYVPYVCMYVCIHVYTCMYV